MARIEITLLEPVADGWRAGKPLRKLKPDEIIRFFRRSRPGCRRIENAELV